MGIMTDVSLFVRHTTRSGESTMRAVKVQAMDGAPDHEQALAFAVVRNPIFAECSADQVLKLCASASVHHARRGTRIATKHSPFPYLGFVIDGVVAVTAKADGEIRSGVRDLRIYEAYPGSTFCEVSFLDGYGTLGEISVVSKRALYALFPQKDVIAAANADPLLLQRLAVHAASRCRELERRLVDQATRPVAARVAAVLLPFASDGSGLAPVDPQLIEFAQRDIAASAGCVKEAAARAIAQLEQAGALRRERGRIRQLDRTQLSYYAEVAESGAWDGV
jgi:CRP-like cAMP-binding protein